MTASTATESGVVVIDASARTMERLCSARSAREFAQVEPTESRTRPIQLTRSIVHAAIGALRDLSEQSDGYHRVKITDALIAAAAAEAGADVVHYDRHFDRLSEVLEFESVWLAPAGSLS